MPNFIITLSLIYAAAVTVRTAAAFFKNRHDRRGSYQLLKNYKKGNFTAIFLAYFPLYLAAFLNLGAGVLQSIVKAFRAMLATVAFSFDYDVLKPMAESSLYFTIVFATVLLLSVSNAGLFSVSVLFRWAYNKHILRRIKKEEKNLCVLIGDGERIKRTVSTVDTNENDVLLLCHEIDSDLKEEAFILKVALLPFPKSSDLCSTLSDACGSFTKRHTSVIFLSDDEDENLNYAYQAAALADSLGKDFRIDGNEKIGLDFYLFSDREKESVYRRVIRRSHGIIHCVNRYQMLAMDFTLKYSIPDMIPHLIDTKSACLKEGTDFRTILIGFGKVNRQLFKIYTQNNQCMTMKDGKPDFSPMTYHIFDKQRSYEDSSFTHSYMQYHSWLEQEHDSDDYFELPSEPALVEFHEANVNSQRFFKELKEAMTDKPTGFNMIVIAMGADSEALDLAEKIAELSRGMGCEDKTGIFVRVRSRELSRRVALRFKNEIPLIPFGDESFPYSYDRIVSPIAEKMAMDRHLCYAIEDKNAEKSDGELQREALEKWLFEWEEIQRRSNVFAILSVRMRLKLLGFDCAPSDSPLPDASAEFTEAYCAGNRIEYEERTVNGKKIVNYKLPYIKPGTPRSTLGELEHYRWNAYHIANGFVPASKSELLRDGKKLLMQRRRHINLTTTRGLMEYDKWRASDLPPTAERPDIIFYDYQLMDDVIWLLDRAGYKIVKPETKKTEE